MNQDAIFLAFGDAAGESGKLLLVRCEMPDSNWIVCDQNIPPGERVTGEIEDEIGLGVVKRGESCP